MEKSSFQIEATNGTADRHAETVSASGSLGKDEYVIRVYLNDTEMRDAMESFDRGGSVTIEFIRRVHFHPKNPD